MKIVCSWCRYEGKAEFVGEKAPLDDARETHGICVTHRREVQIHWQETRQLASISRGRQAAGLSAVLLRWSGLLNITKKVQR